MPQTIVETFDKTCAKLLRLAEEGKVELTTDDLLALGYALGTLHRLRDLNDDSVSFAGFGLRSTDPGPHVEQNGEQDEKEDES